LVTGSGQPSLLGRLQELFPNTFTQENMVTAFDVVHGKPNPEPYLIALKKSGLQANEVVVVENAPLGTKSSSAAGLYTIAINTGPLEAQVLYDGGANIVLESMEELFKEWDQFITQCQ
jgi:beta-phosphoglucomutase-like phosphatase (HAD superfamily)